MSSPAQSTDYDVIIAGGGLVGATLATALARSGRTVAVIEAIEHQADHQPSYDDRTLVVNRASLNILRRLELLPETLGRMPVRHIRISRAGGFGRLELDAENYGVDAFGAVIVARELGNVLLEALADNERISELVPERLGDYAAAGDCIEARLESGKRLTTRLLIGADGNRSRVRELAGLCCEHHDYGQSAMIFNIMPERSEPATAWERFTPDGPLALLPQPGGRLGVVWIAATEQVESALEWPDEALCARLRERFGARLGAFSSPGRRASYPLVRQRTAWPVAERVAVVGNAANAVHPASAQGFNLGLRDVGGLVDALAGHDDPGRKALLNDYARQRHSDQEATVRYTDTLARAFTNPSATASLASGIGLAAHALNPALSQRLVRAAMGFREPVSSLARDQGERP